MSAELLRKAAALMRERAEAATPGPWSNRRGVGEHIVRTETGVPLATTGTRADRRHVASWHPVVARAVALTLEHAAARAEMKILHGGGEEAVWSHERDALAVARAYLGADA